MDFSDSIDPMGIRKPDFDGIRLDPIRSESKIGRSGSSFFLIRSLMHHTKER